MQDQATCHNTGVHHVGLHASDPAQSAEFYKDVLGMQIVGGSSADHPLIWCDPVNIFESLGCFLFLHLPFRGRSQPQSWQVMATIDQADIRGSEPHNHDPSGAASDY